MLNRSGHECGRLGSERSNDSSMVLEEGATSVVFGNVEGRKSTNAFGIHIIARHYF
jgi:hypothetical protein